MLLTVSDHRILMSVLRPNKGNKTLSCRLTRWVDRLPPFDFEVVARSMLGLANYPSRHLTELHGSTVKKEALWNERFTKNSVFSRNDVLENNEATSEQRKPAKNVNENNTINRTNEDEQSPSIKSLILKLLPANYVARR